MFTYVENNNSAKISIVGVGGGGGNAINNMICNKLNGVKFISANTDSQALELSKAEIKIQLGKKLTEGLGAGANPKIGREAALENSETLKKHLIDSHMVFITAGFGGGTGTGSTPVIVELCKNLGILTIAVVTKPFSFEGKKRAQQAYDGIEALKKLADTVITISNNRLRDSASKNARMVDMFKKADEILLHSVKGITDLIMLPGLVNLDFADIKATISKAGMAIMGIGIASGDNRAIKAAERAISHPLLKDANISTATGVLINITSNSDLTMEEMIKASELIYSAVGENAEIIWGTVIDDEVGNEMSITVIATGISDIKNHKPHLSMINSSYDTDLKNFTPINITSSRKLEEPTYIRRNQILEVVTNKNQEEDFQRNLDIDDLDIPTFLRQK